MSGVPQVAMCFASQIWQIFFPSQTLQVFCFSFTKPSDFLFGPSQKGTTCSSALTNNYAYQWNAKSLGLPYFVKYLTIIFVIYQREKVQQFNNINIITLVKAKKGQKVDWAQIIFNSLCSELDRWYKYVRETKGDKKDTYQSTLVLAKIFQYLFVHQKDNPQKPPANVKRTTKEM